MAFITENCLLQASENIHDNVVELYGYSLIRLNRVNKLGGNVYTYIKSSIPFKVLSDLQDECFESL